MANKLITNIAAAKFSHIQSWQEVEGEDNQDQEDLEEWEGEEVHLHQQVLYTTTNNVNNFFSNLNKSFLAAKSVTEDGDSDECTGDYQYSFRDSSKKRIRRVASEI